MSNNTITFTLLYSLLYGSLMCVLGRVDMLMCEQQCCAIQSRGNGGTSLVYGTSQSKKKYFLATYSINSTSLVTCRVILFLRFFFITLASSHTYVHHTRLESYLCSSHLPRVILMFITLASSHTYVGCPSH